MFMMPQFPPAAGYDKCDVQAGTISGHGIDVQGAGPFAMELQGGCHTEHLNAPDDGLARGPRAAGMA
jgi:hypothetical protein